MSNVINLRPAGPRPYDWSTEPEAIDTDPTPPQGIQRRETMQELSVTCDGCKAHLEVLGVPDPHRLLTDAGWSLDIEDLCPECNDRIIALGTIPDLSDEGCLRLLADIRTMAVPS